MFRLLMNETTFGHFRMPPLLPMASSLSPRASASAGVSGLSAYDAQQRQDPGGVAGVAAQGGGDDAQRGSWRSGGRYGRELDRCDRLGGCCMNTVSCLNAMRTPTSPRTQQPTTTTTEIVASTGPATTCTSTGATGRRVWTGSSGQLRKVDEVVTHHHWEGAARSAGGRRVMER